MQRGLLLFILFLSLSLTQSFGQTNDVGTLQSRLDQVAGIEKADLLNQLADQLKQSAPEQAVDYAEEALKISQKENYPQGITKSAYFIGLYAQGQRNWRKARINTQKGLEAAQAMGSPVLEMEGWRSLQSIYEGSGNEKKAEEAQLEYQRIKTSMDLEKRNQQLSVLKDKVQSKEEALEESEEKNQQIQQELEKTREEKLIEEAKLARLAQEKAEIAQQKAELEVQYLQSEKARIENNHQLQRQKSILILLALGIAIALIFTAIVIQYFRLKRLRETEKAKAQRQLMMQDKMATLGQLTAGIAHEIQNPLNFVNNFAEGSSEMTKELTETLSNYQKNPDPEELEIAREIALDLEKNATDIVSNGKRINRIVRSMMEHARGQKGKIQQTDINDLIRRNLYLAYHGFRGLHPDFRANIDEHFDPNLKSIEVIAQDIDRVFLNLFGNACYALHQKQKQSTVEYIPTLKVSTQLKEQDAVITVWDNGPGISKELQQQIFKPFFTTKPADEGHTGLGLSISYDIIVQGHHGKLEVDSEPGQFTEFHIILPA